MSANNLIVHPRWVERFGIWGVNVFAVSRGLVIVQSANRKILKLVEDKK